MGARINYGQVNDVRCPVPVLTGVAIAFKANGGKFVNGYAGALGLAEAADLDILGWAEIGEVTTATTDVITVNVAKDAVYEMPIDTARTEAQLKAFVGKTCDIITTGGIQYADYDLGSYNVLQVVGYGYYGSAAGQQTLWVRINPATSSGVITATSVT